MKYAKVKQGMVPPICLALMLIFVGLPAGRSAQAAPREYAVQIAAVRTQQTADEMRSGLMVQGLEAYWVKIVLPEHGLFYRVRLGKFPSIESAYTYAEVLLDTGLLESYAITAYETPMSGPLRDMTQASIEVQEYLQQGPSPKETGELFALLGARQWLLPATRNLFATAPQAAPPALKQSQGKLPGMSRREMLVFALSRYEWRVTPDPSVFFVRAPMAASSVDLGAGPASPKLEAAPVIQPVASSVVGAPAVSSPSGLTPPPRPNNGFGAERNPAAEIGRGGKPTTSRGIGYGRNPEQARLQATAEMINGQLVMKLRNLDAQRSFTGTARVTLSDDKNSNEISPVQFNLPPDTEMLLPVNDPVAAGSNWMLMVFDDGNALRLVRGASVGGQKPAQTARQNQPGQTNSANPSDQFSLSPPPYVTGVYDATGAPPPMQPTGIIPPNESPNPFGKSASDASPASPTPADAPAQLTITPRQIAATSENVTLEFEIASPQPLNYISITMAAGDYRDVRQALMTTTRGRVPFLVPAVQARSTFIFEIKDEGGRVLGGGTGDFRQLAGGR